MSPATLPKSAGWLSNAQAAKHLQVHPVTLAQWRRKNRGPKFEKLGDGPAARVRYHVRDLDKWVRDRAKAGAA